MAQLIVDLENAAHDSHDEEDVPEEALYLGVVTVSPPKSGLYVLLDGQQRLIVLAMFLAFARDRLPSNSERNSIDRMLVRRSLGRPPEPRFRLTPEDHAWFAHFILPPGATTRLPTSAPLGSPRELLLAARFMEHAFSGYDLEDLRSIVDFLLHHTAMVRSLADQRQASPPALSAPDRLIPEYVPDRPNHDRPRHDRPPHAQPAYTEPAWNKSPEPAARYSVAAE